MTPSIDRLSAEREKQSTIARIRAEVKAARSTTSAANCLEEVRLAWSRCHIADSVADELARFPARTDGGSVVSGAVRHFIGKAISALHEAESFILGTNAAAFSEDEANPDPGIVPPLSGSRGCGGQSPPDEDDEPDCGRPTGKLLLCEECGRQKICENMDAPELDEKGGWYCANFIDLDSVCPQCGKIGCEKWENREEKATRCEIDRCASYRGCDSVEPCGYGHDPEIGRGRFCADYCERRR